MFMEEEQQNQGHSQTQEGQAQGGHTSGGNFKNDPQRASEAGQKGGSR